MIHDKDSVAAHARFARPRAAAHWIIAALIVSMLASGLVGLAEGNDDPGKIDILRIHMVVGLTTLAALLFYAVMALTTRRPPKAPSGHRLLDVLARLVHVGLPLCALVMVLSGIATAMAAGLGEVVFAGKAYRVPEIVRTLPTFHLHACAARAMLVLLLLHLIGGLYHQFVLRDGLLGRMAPWGGR